MRVRRQGWCRERVKERKEVAGVVGKGTRTKGLGTFEWPPFAEDVYGPVTRKVGDKRGN